MALYGKFRELITTALGVPDSGAKAHIHGQGATADAQASATAPTDCIVTVDDVGSITTSMVVQIWSDEETQVLAADGQATFTVTAIIESLPDVYTITLDGTGWVGLLTVPAGARIMPSAAAVTLYADAVGDDTKANPLTTDDNGLAECWLDGGYYDIRMVASVGGAARWAFDYYIGGHRQTSNVLSDSNFVGYRWNTARTLSAGKIAQWVNNGTERMSLDHAGKLQIDGQADIDGGADIEGAVDIAGALTGLTGLTVASGSVSLPAGAIATAALATNAVVDLKAAQTDTADRTVTGVTPGAVGTLSVTFTPDSSDSVIVAIAMIRLSLATGAANAAGLTRIQRTSGTPATIGQVTTRRQDQISDGTAGQRDPITVIGVETGVTGSNTWRLEIAGGDAAQVIHSNGDEQTTYFWVFEFKKAS